MKFEVEEKYCQDVSMFIIYLEILVYFDVILVWFDGLQVQYQFVVIKVKLCMMYVSDQ